MRLTTKQIATAGLLLAICIVSQFFKNFSVFITGPIINACLILATLTCSLIPGLILAVITPITAFFITGNPIMSAIPLMIVMIIAGNAILVLFVYFFGEKTSIRFLMGMILGSIVKAAFMGLTISLWLLPTYLPEAKSAMLPTLQANFSTVQLITALIGAAIAYVVWIPLKKVIRNESL